MGIAATSPNLIGRDPEPRRGHPGGPCATALAVVLGGEPHDRVGVCTAPNGDRVFSTPRHLPDLGRCRYSVPVIRSTSRSTSLREKFAEIWT
jgi:hypothetical protein